MKKEGCEKIFQEKASGAQRDRPELKAALGYMRKGDTLVVWKIDRLARSMKQLIETIESFQNRGIGLKSLQDPIDTNSRAVSSSSMNFACYGDSGRVEKGVMNPVAFGFTGGYEFSTAAPIIPRLHPVCDVPPMHRYHLSPALSQVRMPAQ